MSLNKRQLAKDTKAANAPKIQRKDSLLNALTFDKSKLGYRDDSPFRDEPFIDIHTPNGMIDMSNTGIPLMANGRRLEPYSGQHQFDTNVVREVPIHQQGGTVQMPQVDITAEGPRSFKYRTAWETSNPLKGFLDKHMPEKTILGSAGLPSYVKDRTARWEQLRADAVAKKLLDANPKGSKERLDWLRSFSPKELEYLQQSKHSQKLGPTKSSRIAGGLAKALTFGSDWLPEAYKNEILPSERSLLDPLLTPFEYVGDVTQAALLPQSETGVTFGEALKGENVHVSPGKELALDASNLMGLGLGKSVLSGLKGLNTVNKAVTMPLKAAQEMRALESFADPEKFYRVVRGHDAARDYLNAGLVRTPQKTKGTTSGIQLDGRPTAWPSFSKGKVSTSYAKGDPVHYIIETQEPLGVSTKGRHGRGTTYFPTKDGQYIKELPVTEKTKLFAPGEGGYKEVTDVNSLPGFEEGGQVVEMDDAAIERYKRMGYRIEDVEEFEEGGEPERVSPEYVNIKPLLQQPEETMDALTFFMNKLKSSI